MGAYGVTRGGSFATLLMNRRCHSVLQGRWRRKELVAEAMPTYAAGRAGSG